MNSRNLVLAVTLLLGGLLCTPAPAHAYSFYWSKVEVHAVPWRVCMSFAYDSTNQLGLSQVRRDNLAVTGSRNGADATITCIGTAGKAMAVIMVVGDVDQPVRQLRDDLVAKITGMVCFDTGCS